MSKVFYDHLIVLEEVDEEIRGVAETDEERHELWQLVDEIVHHRVLAKILDHLPEKHHEEFAAKVHETPHDEGLMDYLNAKIEHNVEELIKQEIGDLAYEILEEIRSETREK